MKTLQLLSLFLVSMMIGTKANAVDLEPRASVHKRINEAYEYMANARVLYNALDTNLENYNSSQQICMAAGVAQNELDKSDMEFRNAYISLSEARAEGKFQINPLKGLKTYLYMKALKNNVKNKMPTIYDPIDGFSLNKFCSGISDQRFSDLSRDQQKDIRKQIKEVFGFTKSKIHRLDRKGWKSVVNSIYDKLDEEPQMYQIPTGCLAQNQDGSPTEDMFTEIGYYDQVVRHEDFPSSSSEK